MLLKSSDLLDLLLPRSCVACDAPMARGMVCGLCWSRMPVLGAPQCERCGHPREGRGGAHCGYCALLPPFVRAARSVCWVPDPTASAAVHALKYDGWERVADEMADRMLRLPWPPDVVGERSLVIPVPLAPARLRERGYNQAEMLARPLARRWGIPLFGHALRRTRNTVTQTRLTPSERSANVLDAFQASDANVPTQIAGAHVVLVDDVLTTGATLNAAAGALFDAGARIVSYVTFARARTSSD